MIVLLLLPLLIPFSNISQAVTHSLVALLCLDKCRKAFIALHMSLSEKPEGYG